MTKIDGQPFTEDVMQERADEQTEEGTSIELPLRDATEIPAVDTSDWSTYRNEQYGFEMRYPNNFIAYKGFSSGEPIEAGSTSSEFWIARKGGTLRYGEPLTIGVRVIENTLLTPQEWLEKTKKIIQVLRKLNLSTMWNLQAEVRLSWRVVEILLRCINYMC